MFLKTKLKNAVSQYGNYEYFLNKNIINGQVRGCSGFIKNPQNDVVLYVNTEPSIYAPLADKTLVRYAKNKGDYGGSHSRNTFATDKDLALHIHKMLNNKKDYVRWMEGIK